jgi:DNA polymerase II small subunit/DNA polymerase delta subunit B
MKSIPRLVSVFIRPSGETDTSRTKEPCEAQSLYVSSDTKIGGYYEKNKTEQDLIDAGGFYCSFLHACRMCI